MARSSVSCAGFSKLAFVCLLGTLFTSVEPVEAQQPAELIIRNGLIVTAEGRTAADVRIVGELIAEIGPNLASSADAREIDAAGMLLLPGAVDTHTHLNPVMPDPPRPTRPQDDYVTGSAAAFAGGVTTLSNFIPFQSDEDVAAYAEGVIGAIEQSAMADFFIHVVIQNDPARFTANIDELAAHGFVSTGEDFLARESYDANVLDWYKAFRASGPAGVLSMIHAEDYAILAEAHRTLLRRRNGRARAHIRRVREIRHPSR